MPESSTASYLDSIPSPVALEGRVNQFFQLGGTQPPTSTIPQPPSSPLHISNHHHWPSLSQQYGHCKAYPGLGTSGESHSSHQPRSVVSINPVLSALLSKLLQRIWTNEYIGFAELRDGTILIFHLTIIA